MKKIHNERLKIILFTIFATYIIIYELMIWTLVASSVYFLHWSAWILLLGVLMSTSQLKPIYFGLDYNIK